MNFNEIEAEAKKFREHRASLRTEAEKKALALELEKLVAADVAQARVADIWREYRGGAISQKAAAQAVNEVWLKYKNEKFARDAKLKAIWAEYRKAVKVPFKYADM